MEIFKSKKFWAAIVGEIAMVVSEFTGMSVEAIVGMLTVIVSYIIGQGIADNGKEKAKIDKWS